MTANVYLAPAKLNLFLHVVGRRADGYHLIQSVFRLIDLADRLTIVTTGDGVVARANDVPGVAEDDDLAIRAARALKAASGCRAGATIAIEKRIPMGGGLGGGSSDAASVLLALNRLWHLDWPCSRLMALGARLGADVPFFIGGTNAFVEGIGERLTPIALPNAHYAVVHPGVSVPTSLIFGAPELTRDTELIKLAGFSESGSVPPALAQNDGGPDYRNDLEAPAARRFDAIREALSWLSRDIGGEWTGARGSARMSGSGACVFREFDSTHDALACIAALPPKWSGWAVCGMSDHPLKGYCVD